MSPVHMMYQHNVSLGGQLVMNACARRLSGASLCFKYANLCDEKTTAESNSVYLITVILKDMPALVDIGILLLFVLRYSPAEKPQALM